MGVQRVESMQININNMVKKQSEYNRHLSKSMEQLDSIESPKETFHLAFLF